jgi:hypothetical protein
VYEELTKTVNNLSARKTARQKANNQCSLITSFFATDFPLCHFFATAMHTCVLQCNVMTYDVMTTHDVIVKCGTRNIKKTIQ